LVATFPGGMSSKCTLKKGKNGTTIEKLTLIPYILQQLQLVVAFLCPCSINHLGMLQNNYILTNIIQQECPSNSSMGFQRHENHQFGHIFLFMKL
jgi:hypothetical protein